MSTAPPNSASLARLIAGCGVFVAVVVTVLLAPLVMASACPAMTGGSDECTTTSFSLVGLVTDLWLWLAVVLPVVAVTIGAALWLRRLERSSV